MSFNTHVPESWHLVKLSDLGEVNRGRSRHRPRDAAHLYGGSYPFIQTGDVKASGGRITKYTQTYSEDGLAQSRLWPEKTMCITIAANIAETGILTFPACFPDSVIGFIPDENRCNVYFIEYIFRLLRKGIQAQASGSVQDNINLQTLEILQFPIPELEEQNTIAKLLNSFDDKIEQNRQINQTLEQIAQAIFKSWFVDFEPVKAKIAAKENGRDPERAAMRAISGKSDAELNHLPADQLSQLATTAALFPDELIDSELGLIPKGWSSVRFKSIVEKYIDNRGKTPPTTEKGIPLLEVKHLPDKEIRPNLKTTRYVTQETYDSWFRTHLIEDDIIISTVGTIGRICLVPKNEKFTIAQNLLGLRFNRKKASPNYMYYQMDGFRFRHDVDARLVITVQSSIKRKDLETIALLLPSIEIQNEFEKRVKPLVKNQQNTESEMLNVIRDTLLPKLLSGEISVAETQAEIEAAV